MRGVYEFYKIYSSVFFFLSFNIGIGDFSL